jgi:hypothetical protein
MSSLKRSLAVSAALLAVSLLAAPAWAQAEAGGAKPPAKTIGGQQQTYPSLIVLNARGAILQGGALTLKGVSPNAVVFADRPVRAAGHALTRHVLEDWEEGETFAMDPPNATVSTVSNDGETVKDAVVVLKDPKLQGDDLVFAVQVLEGDLAGAVGPDAVFIDIIGMPLTPFSVAGVARRTARRTAWYAGAAAPYYPPPPPPAYYYRPPVPYPYYRPYY